MATFADLNPDATQLQQRVERFHAVREDIVKQVREVIVGQDEVLDQILIALFVGGHCLITGLPGTAKTLMVRTLAEALGLAIRASSSPRISCPPISLAPISSKRI